MPKLCVYFEKTDKEKQSCDPRILRVAVKFPADNGIPTGKHKRRTQRP